MIKLIAADLDGTLLHNDKSIPEDFERLLDALDARGVVFVFASGRPLASMRSKFGKYMERTACICSNGCMLVLRNEVLHANSLSAEDIRYLVREGEKAEGLVTVLIGENKEYHTYSDPEFIELMDLYCMSRTQVSDYEEVIGTERILKVTYYDAVDPVTHGMPQMQHLTDRFELIPSGEAWLDTVLIGQDKGACLQKLQKHLGVTEEETMCFGDFHNDAGLMKHCKYSYAMKNAHPDLKALCRYETEKTNEEDGVIDTVCKELGITL